MQMSGFFEHFGEQLRLDQILFGARTDFIIEEGVDRSCRDCGTFRVMRKLGILPEQNNEGTSRGLPIRSGLRAASLTGID